MLRDHFEIRESLSFAGDMLKQAALAHAYLHNLFILHAARRLGDLQR